MSSPDPVAMARRIALQHPGATLGCPACDASLTASNLDRHLGKVHPDVLSPAPTAWRGVGRVFRGHLALRDGHLELRRPLGLDRRVALPAAVTVGGARTTRADVIDVSLDVPTPRMHEERAGVYLQVGTGRRSIAVRCPSGGGVRRHWSGWQQGPRRRRWHITLAAPDFAALQYALAEVGMLQLRTA